MSHRFFVLQESAKQRQSKSGVNTIRQASRYSRRCPPIYWGGIPQHVINLRLRLVASSSVAVSVFVVVARMCEIVPDCKPFTGAPRKKIRPIPSRSPYVDLDPLVRWPPILLRSCHIYNFSSDCYTALLDYETAGEGPKPSPDRATINNDSNNEAEARKRKKENKNKERCESHNAPPSSFRVLTRKEWDGTILYLVSFYYISMTTIRTAAVTALLFLLLLSVIKYFTKNWQGPAIRHQAVVVV